MKKIKKKLMVLIALAVIMTMTVNMSVTVEAAGGQYTEGTIPMAVTPGGVTVYGYYHDYFTYSIPYVDFPMEYLLAIDAAGITDDMTEYEKCVRINNYLCAVAEYGLPETSMATLFNAGDSLDLESFLVALRSTEASGVSLIRTGKAICQGYTDAFQTMASMLGMQCYIMDSDSLNHAWNVVMADGVIYFVDVTWNDYLNTTNYLMSTDLWDDHMAEDVALNTFVWFGDFGFLYSANARDYR